MLLVSSVPCQPHFEVIGCSLCYLKGTPKNGLLYKPSFSVLVMGFSDVDCGAIHFDRQSTSNYFGYCTFVEGSLVIWCSNK